MKVNKLRHKIFIQTQSAMIIFSDINIRYLSAFSGHAATILVTDKVNYLITDYRYFEQAKEQAIGFKVICRDRANQTLAGLIAELLKQENCSILFFESEHINVAHWQDMVKEIKQFSSVTDITPLTSTVEKFRMIKSTEEISYIKQAAAIADQALANIIPLVKTGITERKLANELDYQMAKLGSEELSFVTILAFGERSALPHAIPSERTLKQGDLILIDFGAVVNGYRSDMTRTFVFGKATTKQQSIYQLVKRAQQAAIDAIKEDVIGNFLYQQSANILLNSDYSEYVGEGLGHGVGLQLHEQPFIGPDCEATIKKGCVITIEPGIYIPNWGGIRIEDDVVLTENGLVVLTQAPKHLTEL